VPTPEPRLAAPAVASLDPRPNLLGLTREEMTAALAPLGEPAYRARQLWDAIHLRFVLDFAAMTELSRPLRAALAERFRITLPAVADRHASRDGTTKYLFRLEDGATIEAVDIPDRHRRTLCISSQAGCALACRFCVTGYWGAGRNLTPAEIAGQVWAIRTLAASEGRLNLVFMGMGEPLLNLDAVRSALAVMAPTISPRRITLSTAGLVPGLDELARWPERPHLAVSLHAPDDRRRSELMPVNRIYPLAELLAALRRFPLEPRRRHTFEYLLIAGFNDADGDASALAALLGGLRAKVNLIPFNPDPVLPAEWQPPAPERVAAFRSRLERHGLTATIRKRRGDDVNAACGQLRAFGRAARGFRRSQLSF
jgi:23S rRNA (adenine2503-C2)-methyltransferase